MNRREWLCAQMGWTLEELAQREKEMLSEQLSELPGMRMALIWDALAKELQLTQIIGESTQSGAGGDLSSSNFLSSQETEKYAVLVIVGARSGDEAWNKVHRAMELWDRSSWDVCGAPPLDQAEIDRSTHWPHGFNLISRPQTEIGGAIARNLAQAAEFHRDEESAAMQRAQAEGARLKVEHEQALAQQAADAQLVSERDGQLWTLLDMLELPQSWARRVQILNRIGATLFDYENMMEERRYLRGKSPIVDEGQFWQRVYPSVYGGSDAGKDTADAPVAEDGDQRPPVPGYAGTPLPPTGGMLRPHPGLGRTVQGGPDY